MCVCHSQAANFSLPPHLSFLATMSFFTKSVKLFNLFCKEVHCTHVWIPPGGITCDACFVLRAIISSSSCGWKRPFILSVAGQRGLVCACPIFFTHALDLLHLGFLHILDMAPGVAMIVGMQYLLNTWFSEDPHPGVRWLGHLVLFG